ncbi:class I SAM-dependent methyltransferase [Asaia platycodi]|uniref:hypothetical protein n=1 Tax=Asaia platycodi TaxID=610243 RepID=UPI0009DCA8C0
MSDTSLKSQPERLYGRQRGHPLRARQQRLLDEALPRLRLNPEQAIDPKAAFTGAPVDSVWLEIGFGGGEHALDQAQRNPDIGYIAAEVSKTGYAPHVPHRAGRGRRQHHAARSFPYLAR